MIRLAAAADLAAIVAIYNASIPGRMATADLDPVKLEDRAAWFEQHPPDRRPIWVEVDDATGGIAGWISLSTFYGRPAYQATVEISLYVHPDQQRRGVGRRLVEYAIAHAPPLGVRTLLAFVFGHNDPSIRLLTACGFEPWGRLPGIAELDGVRRDLHILGRRVV